MSETQDSKFGQWRPDAEHATSRSRRLHTILNHYGRARKKLDGQKFDGLNGVRTRDLRLSKQAALATAPGPPACAVI